jgi:hypothetical protein
MMKTILAALYLAIAAGGADYKPEPEWLKLPEGRTEIGSMHGTVAVSSANEVYINVEGTVRQRFAVLGPNPGLQVYSADGKYLRNVPNAPFDLHGFIIRKEGANEFIYASRLAASLTAPDQTRAGLDQEAIIKMTLDGKMVLTIPRTAIFTRPTDTPAITSTASTRTESTSSRSAAKPRLTDSGRCTSLPSIPVSRRRASSPAIARITGLCICRWRVTSLAWPQATCWRLPPSLFTVTMLRLPN